MSTVRPSARTPQRERGRRRVAALLDAAAAVFAEKGYAAATMTEIAARAQAPIGSLYQFFPGKEALGDALIRRYTELAVDALAAIEARADAATPDALAAALLGVFVALRRERAAAIALVDAAPRGADPRGEAFRRAVLARIEAILTRRAPALARERAAAAAAAVLQQMKSAAAAAERRRGVADGDGVHAELRRMLELYLAAIAADGAPAARPPRAARERVAASRAGSGARAARPRRR